MVSSPPSRQHGKPLLIGSLSGVSPPRKLEKLHFRPDADDPASFDEGWLQDLIDNNPSLLPLNEIEPGFGPLISLCKEMPTKAGYIDNVFVTGEGNIVLAECKLWRNPEARREVVAQIMDYAQAMSSWGYGEFNEMVKKANPSITSIFDHVCQRSDMEEHEYADAISRNLSLGRVLLLIVGDGIRSQAEDLTQSLQKHAGFHFTLSLVEVPVYRLPSGEYLVIPRILARTVNIERGIVSVQDGKLNFQEPRAVSPSSTPLRKTISVEQGMEILRAHSPETVQALERFMEQAAERGIYLDAATKSLVLRWPGPDDKAFALGYIKFDGDFVTDSVNWEPSKFGRVDLSHEYLDDLAALVNGRVRKTSKPENWYVLGTKGKYIKIDELLSLSSDWLSLIDKYINNLTLALKND